MRFGAPRSPSPSRRRSRDPRRSSTYGLHSDSGDSDECSDSDSSSSSGESSSASGSLRYSPDSRVPQPLSISKRHSRTPAEQRVVEDTVAAIRLRTRHRDPYEEWERETRKDAFRTARKEQSVIRSQLHEKQHLFRSQESARLAAAHAKQMKEVETQLETLRLRQQSEEVQLRSRWKERDRVLWERIEGVIEFEEKKVRAQQEVERKKQEQEDMKRREEETKKRLEAEKRTAELEQKRKEEEEKQLQEAREEEERKKLEEIKKLSIQRSQAEEQERKALGLTTAEEDWAHARSVLKGLKDGPMKTVKGDKGMKSTWSNLRRQITPKIGQLTNDPAAISHISQQLCTIIGVRPSAQHPPDIYYALLSSLAKAILLQAETEVTAEKRSAIPLALVTVNLLTALDGFADIFFAKLVQRSGGWPIPTAVPVPDGDDRAKLLGYRPNESSADYTTRVSGIMRVYFHILHGPVERPLHRMFQLPRYWAYFARMMTEVQLLEAPVAPQILYSALDVCGMEAKDIWGQQWIKMLALLYEGVTVGVGGRFIGGPSAEGKAGRMRVQLEVERIMGVQV